MRYLYTVANVVVAWNTTYQWSYNASRRLGHRY